MYNIGYMSRATHRFTISELASLCDQSSENNQRAGITGLLVHDSSRFMQIIEGDDDVIRHLMGKIIADTRHHDISYIADGCLESRNFKAWALLCVGFNENLTPIDLLTDVKSIVRNVTDANLMAAFIGFARLAK